MLDKNSEIILKYAISKFDGNMDREIYISPTLLDIDYTEFNSLCKELRKNKYLYVYSSAASNQDSAYLRLTSKGLNYFELKRKEKIKYWIPITISLIALLKSFWPDIIWLLNIIMQQ